MALFRAETTEIDDLLLGSVAVDEGDAVSIEDVGKLMAAEGYRWAPMSEVCAFWNHCQGRDISAELVVTCCPDLPEGHATVIAHFPVTRWHSLNVVRHQTIAAYHWPHHLDGRKFLVVRA